MDDAFTPDPRAVYDPQSHHHGIPDIRRLGRLTVEAACDTPYLQAVAYHYYNEHRRALFDAPFLDRDTMRARQLDRLARLVDHAYAHVPFYRRLYGSVGYEPGAIRSFRDLASLPIIDKAILSGLGDDALLTSGTGEQATFTTRSSGSSGTPFTTHLDTFDVVRDFAEMLRFFTMATKGRLEREDWIYTIHHGGHWFSSLMGHYRIFRLMDLEEPEPLARHWALLRPKIVTTLPSYLPKLAQLGALDRFGIAAVSTNSEMSSRAERDRYARIFGVPVVDEYSSEEIGFMATECCEGQYHVVEDGVFFETVDCDAGGTGRVVVTDLNNILMPLIRYDHGDLACLSEGTCRCGCQGRLVSDLHGRRDDAFLNASGVLLPTAALLAICDDLMNEAEFGLASYRLVQRAPARIDLLFTRHASASAPVETLRRDLADRLGRLFGHPVDIRAIAVDALPQTGSYKRRVLLRQFDGGG